MNLKSLVPWGHKPKAPVHYREPGDPMINCRREIDQLFDDFFEAFNGFGPRALMRGEKGWPAGMPSIDVTDSDKELVVAAELPGVDEKDVEVTLEGDVLTIRGEKKHEHEEKDGERHYVERSYGSFSRSVRLPFEAGDQDARADFDKGVLTIRIPKPAEIQSKVKQIEVKAH